MPARIIAWIVASVSEANPNVQTIFVFLINQPLFFVVGLATGLYLPFRTNFIVAAALVFVNLSVQKHPRCLQKFVQPDLHYAPRHSVNFNRLLFPHFLPLSVENLVENLYFPMLLWKIQWKMFITHAKNRQIGLIVTEYLHFSHCVERGILNQSICFIGKNCL